MVDHLERAEHPPAPAPGAEGPSPREDDERQLPRAATVAVRGRLDNAQANGDPRFLALQSRFRVRTALVVGICLGWYLLYLMLSAFARDLMAMHVLGQVNLAMVLGLGQFASTFLLAWAFAHFARRRHDPDAAALRAELDGSDPDPGPGRPGW